MVTAVQTMDIFGIPIEQPVFPLPVQPKYTRMIEEEICRFESHGWAVNFLLVTPALAIELFKEGTITGECLDNAQKNDQYAVCSVDLNGERYDLVISHQRHPVLWNFMIIDTCDRPLYVKNLK